MPPPFTVGNPRSCGLSYPKANSYDGKLFSMFTHCANLPHLKLVELQGRIENLALGVPPFGTHVPHVVCVGTEPKVSWIYARWIIAMVKNMQTIWNSSVVYDPGRTMGTAALFVMPKLAVTVFVYRAFPYPAFIRSKPRNFYPKSFYLIERAFDFCVRVGKYFYGVIHTNSMFDFSEGRRLQPAVFALSGYDTQKEMQA